MLYNQSGFKREKKKKKGKQSENSAGGIGERSQEQEEKKTFWIRIFLSEQSLNQRVRARQIKIDIKYDEQGKINA